MEGKWAHPCEGFFIFIGRSKVCLEPCKIETLFQDADDLLNNMVRSTVEATKALDEEHTKERRRLVTMDIKDLKAMMPQLIIFHKDLRKAAELEKQNMKDASKTARDKKICSASDVDENTVDIPMDYKMPDY